MKRTISIILAGLLLLTIGVSIAYGQLGTTDNSSFTVQNLGTATATVTVTFYDEAGTAYTPDPLNAGKSNPFTLDPGASFEVYLPGISGLPDGRYSVVISADQPIVAIANLIGEEAGPTYYNGSYSGFEAGDTPLYLPSALYEAWNWNSLISVQNVGANPTDITVEIYSGATVVATENYSDVPPSTAVHLDFETEGAGLGLTAGFSGSAVVTSSAEPIVATDNQTADGGYMVSYNGFLSGAQTLHVPALYNGYYTWDASLNIQNIGAGSTDVTVTYSDGDTPSSFTLGPNESELLYMPTEKTLPTTRFAATITSTAEDIVAIANAANPAKQALTYNAFATGTDTVGLPTVMNDYYDWDTSFTIQNIGTASTTVTYSYSDVGCPSGDCTFDLDPGESEEIYQPGDGLSAGYRGSVTATSSGSVPIAGIVNETNSAGQAAGTGDWSMSYNGFNQ